MLPVTVVVMVVQDGPEMLRNCILSAEPYPIRGLFRCLYFPVLQSAPWLLPKPCRGASRVRSSCVVPQVLGFL